MNKLMRKRWDMREKGERRRRKESTGMQNKRVRVLVRVFFLLKGRGC